MANLIKLKFVYYRVSGIKAEKSTKHLISNRRLMRTIPMIRWCLHQYGRSSKATVTQGKILLSFDIIFLRLSKWKAKDFPISSQLKTLIEKCEISTLRDSLVKDIIVCRVTVTDNKSKERLLREAELTLDKAIKLGHAAEETRRHVKELKKKGKFPTTREYGEDSELQVLFV